jgi:hypothetical protein
VREEDAVTHDDKWGGIPPDEDHKSLLVCSAPNCHKNATFEPLVVVALAGGLRVLCRKHLADPDVGARRMVMGGFDIPPPKKEDE